MDTKDYERWKAIIERLQTDNVVIGLSRTNFFSSVPQRVIRYIVSITLIGAGGSSGQVTIEKTEAAGTHTVKFQAVPLSPTQVQPLPPTGENILNPLTVIEGGTSQNITGIIAGPTVCYATVRYWDDQL